MKDGVVILGAGHAGVQVAASLRQEGYDGKLIIVSDESDLPYHRPPLSKSFIKGDEANGDVLRADKFYSERSIELNFGKPAKRIDRQDRRLVFGDGSGLVFDRLIVATGARPRIIHLPGSGLDGVMTLRTIADARSIRERSRQAEHIVIVGGGFIGLEIAATLARDDRQITVVEAQDRLLGRAVAETISTHARLRLQQSGIAVLCSTTIDRLEGDSHVTAVVLSDGRRIPAQMVIVGIGVVPNVELATDAGLLSANGIKVDAHMQSSIPQILAIGDCASYYHWLTGTDVRLESVQNATDQAKLAARTIAGHSDRYDSIPWFWSDIGDIKLQMVGLATGSDQQIVLGDPSENRFSIFRYAGDRLLAIESINRPGDHMLARRMIAAGYSPSRKTVSEGIDAIKSTFASWQLGTP